MTEDAGMASVPSGRAISVFGSKPKHPILRGDPCLPATGPVPFFVMTMS
jgi:hypothetical protein